jgi:chromosome segregation protein
MKIRRLEIQGFKSFADRTSFDFDAGISAIVGPNGCGKSNVVDAIKWALGEMSPKSLRGKRMEDVIFAGSRTRKPSALSEVTLVLDNQDGLLKTEHAEVAITRRLNRAGESDYLINAQPARLKDIRELFLDTGLGIDGNAIMEQGRIDALLTADSMDRRGIFEEAAGVSRYKQRRKEAEQKLQRTHENLERLRDVLDLEEKRWRSLKVQAGRARRYQELREELTKNRLLRAVSRYQAIATEREQVQERMRALLAEEAEAVGRLAELDAQAKAAQAAREAARDEVAALEAKIAQSAADARAAEERAGWAGRAADDLRQRVESARRQAAEARQRAEALAVEQRDLDASHAAAQAEAERCAADVAQADAELAQLDRRAAEIRDAHDGAKREALAALGRIAAQRNLETERRAEMRQAEDRLARLAQRHQELEAQRERSGAEARELLDAATRLAEAAHERATALSGAEEARARALKAVEESGRRRAASAEERATKSARLEVLERLNAAREGVEEGARAVLAAVEGAAPDSQGARQGVLGLLADLVEAAGPGAAALDRLLGHAAGAVVVSSRADALRWVEWLKARGKHERARFLCLDLVRRDAPALPREVGALGGAEALCALVASVVAGTELVPDLETGIRRWLEGGVNAVTPQGERVTSSGALLAGRDGPALGLVERIAEVRHLRLERTRLAEAVEAAQAEVTRAQQDAAAYEERIRALRRELASLAEDKSRGQEALARVDKAGRELAGQVELVERERAEFETLHADAGAALVTLAAALEALEGERASLEERAEEAGRGYLAVESERKAALERRMELKLAHAQARSQAEAAAERRERARREHAELVERATAQDADAADMTTKIGQAEVDAAEALARVRAAEVERREAADTLVGARERLASSEGEAGVHEQRHVELERRKDDVKERLDASRLEDSEYRVRIESLLDQVRQDQGLDLAAAAAEPGAGAVPEGVDLDALLDDLRRKIEELGNVNLNAIGELEEAEQRVTFLKREEGDLLGAKTSLEQAIVELDALSTTRFAETFEAVREHFRETFRRLFGGGRAEIVLEDASKPLESGVDIVARPPGKEQRTISLLSGGERTLTAVALLFAVFKAKPSPFAILDEVDAALDEANVRRLIGLVREFTDRSQFLVVTHAKTTMEAADVLFGVTMEEAGVSKKVGVRLTEYPAESTATA